ncbi:MAG: glycoside hydrolase family 95 protein, partial [Prevotellaceae bacterium]|nr:glycoside hydrolase family 95 protein [Prevotellaceae bacterium]
EIFLLPAVPDKWGSGSVKGIRCKGGFTVDLEWEAGKITKAVIYSVLGGNCRIRTYSPVRLQSHYFQEAIGVNPNPFYFTDNSTKIINGNNNQHLAALDFKKTYLIDFDTEKGGKYELNIKSKNL